MCGIVGVHTLSSIGADHAICKVFREAVVADTVRGYDGTGIFFVNKTKGKLAPFYYKEVKTGAEFLGDTAAYSKMLDDAIFMCGHNRAATIGSLDEENTHPFSVGQVVGVHNGTIHNWDTSLKEHVDEAGMDSHAVFEALSKTEPTADAITNLLVKLDGGAYALVWYDNRTQRIYFARNHSRPMNFVKTRTSLWWGSELRMLEWVLDRNRADIVESWELPVHTLVSIPVLPGTIEVTSYSKKVLDSRPSYQYTPPSQSYYRGAYNQSRVYNSWDDWEDDRWDVHGQGGFGGKGWQRNPGGQVLLPEVIDPKFIDIRKFGSIGEALTCGDPVVRTSLYTTCRQLLGCPLSQPPSGYLELSDALAEHMAGKVADVKVERGLVRVPVHIVHSQHSTLYGYIKVGDTKVAASIPRCSIGLQSVISSILAEKHNVIVPNVLIVGLRLYHHGDFAYLCAPPTCSSADVKKGDKVNWATDSATQTNYGYQHPDIVCIRRTANWEAGWK